MQVLYWSTIFRYLYLTSILCYFIIFTPLYLFDALLVWWHVFQVYRKCHVLDICQIIFLKHENTLQSTPQYCLLHFPRSFLSLFFFLTSLFLFLSWLVNRSRTPVRSQDAPNATPIPARYESTSKLIQPKAFRRGRSR